MCRIDSGGLADNHESKGGGDSEGSIFRHKLGEKNVMVFWLCNTCVVQCDSLFRMQNPDDLCFSFLPWFFLLFADVWTWESVTFAPVERLNLMVLGRVWWFFYFQCVISNQRST